MSELNYFDTLKEAIRYDVAGLKLAEGTMNIYIYDTFIFEFSLIKERFLAIYVYDSNYDLYTDFYNAALKIYENEWLDNAEWLDKDIWQDKLDECIGKMQKDIGDRLDE